ncbi:MAG: DUF4231 domain-containing protein [Myxacorys californica WJT36-NPBG1]|nr:DUF4231 domain-containing protein [Myxacorys californica WJT36-NPBG1]
MEIAIGETPTDDFQRSLIQKHTEALEECDRLIQRFKHIADSDKRRFTRLNQASVLLTFVVTILSTLAASKQLGVWEWIVPIISALAALSTTLLSQNTSQKTWVNARNVQQKLQSEKFLYLQDAGDYFKLEGEEKTRRFSDRVMEIWSEGHQNWGQSASEKKK